MNQEYKTLLQSYATLKRTHEKFLSRAEQNVGIHVSIHTSHDQQHYSESICDYQCKSTKAVQTLFNRLTEHLNVCTVCKYTDIGTVCTLEISAGEHCMHFIQPLNTTLQCFTQKEHEMDVQQVMLQQISSIILLPFILSLILLEVAYSMWRAVYRIIDSNESTV